MDGEEKPVVFRASGWRCAFHLILVFSVMMLLDFLLFAPSNHESISFVLLGVLSVAHLSRIISQQTIEISSSRVVGSSGLTKATDGSSAKGPVTILLSELDRVRTLNSFNSFKRLFSGLYIYSVDGSYIHVGGLGFSNAQVREISTLLGIGGD